VNPGRDEVLGVPCFPTVRDLPERAETAVLLVGHQRLEAAMADAIEAGIRSFVVPGLGNEAGGEGALVLDAVRRLVTSVGGRMLGPNCMGLAVPDGPSPWLAELPSSFLPGRVAAVVQSGSIGEALVALGPRVGFRAVISTGGEADVGLAELVEYFAADERTCAIALFVETVRKSSEFAAALEQAARHEKPVVCLKVGASAAAARAALAHTGAIVGSARSFSALLRRTGALEVDDLPELIETLEILGRRRWPTGLRTGAVSESGGEAALLADRSAERGLVIEPLPETVRAALVNEFPTLVAPQNPVDAWAADDPDRIFPRTLELLGASGAFDLLIAQVDLSRFRSAADQAWNRMVVEALGRVAAQHELFGAVTTTHTSDPPDWAYQLARDLDIALLRGAGNAAGAIARVAAWQPRVPLAPGWSETIPIGDLLVRDGALPEHESCAILERYGVQFAAREQARTPEDAAVAAARLGLPVVVKRDGPAHKARNSGVLTGIETAEQAAHAAAELGGPVLVARQVPAGEELFCGAVRDPEYGPVIAVGAGGSNVETSGRCLAVVGPVSERDARDLVEQAGLADPHGTLATAAAAVSRLAAEHPEVVEVDINQLIRGESATIAVDALVVVDRS
jgi:acetyltransferase